MHRLTRTLTNPWLLASWPKVAWAPADDDEALGTWEHVRSTLVGRDSDGLLRGESTWVSRVDGAAVGAGWEWVEWRRGVVVLADPMAIVSNLDAPCTGHAARALLLVRLAHNIGWEWQALSALARGRPVAPSPRDWRAARPALSAVPR